MKSLRLLTMALAVAGFAAAQPVISNVSPSSAILGGPADVPILITGSFSPSAAPSVYFVSPSDVATALQAAQVEMGIEAVIPRALLAQPGTAGIRVTVGNLSSNDFPFAVNGPAVTGISPSELTVGPSQEKYITVYGSGFAAVLSPIPSVVHYIDPSGGDHPANSTAYISETQLVATFPASVFSTPGTGSIRVAAYGTATVSNSVPLFVNPKPFVAATALPPGVQDRPYGEVYIESSGGTGERVITGSGLPAGLTLGDNVLSGFPTVAGTFQVSLTVTDSTGASSSTTLPLVINPPLTITTSSLPAGTLNVPYPPTTLSATGGSPSNFPYMWFRTEGGAMPPGLTLNSSGIITGTPTSEGPQAVDATVQDSYDMVSKTLSIMVYPQASITSTTLTSGQVGTPYSVTLAATPQGPAYTWTYLPGSTSALPPGLSLTSNGALSGTPTQSGTFSFLVQASNTAGGSATQLLSVSISPAPVVITTASPLLGGTVGAAYNQPLAATGGTSPYTWSIATGSLPSGLSLSSAGVISGTPTQVGAFNFTVTATDSSSGNAMTGQKAFSINIQPAPVVITTASPLQVGTVNAAYNQTLAASGGTPPFMWSIATGTLPTGLSLSSAGVISGTPTQVGAFNFTVTASDSTSGTAMTAQKALSISIQPAPVAITTSTLSAGTVGVAYNQTLAAAGGTPPYTWSIATGALPGGLTLSSAGVITGSPTQAGTANFTVTAIDSTSGTAMTAQKALSISIQPAPVAITTSTLSAGTVGVAYNQTLAAAGGTPPYTWSIATGSLPAGLTLSSAGAISGTPTQAGTANFTVTAIDSTSGTAMTAQKALSISIQPAPVAITTSTLSAGTVGVAYNQTLAAAGGTPPYTWSIATGALPGGLTLSSAGVITGSPTHAGTTNFTVTATDSTSGTAMTAQKALSISIQPAPVAITTSTLSAGTVGVAYNQTLAAAGGTPPYTWSIATGSLPAGLTLSSAGAISGTPTQAGTANFTVTAIDSTSGTAMTAQKALSISIQPAPLVIATDSLPKGTVGAAYTREFGASGGTPPYTWSIATGSLPARLSLDSAGVLSGTPTRAGAFNFTLSVSDSTPSAPMTSESTFSLTIEPATLAITTSTLPAGTVGSAYSHTLAGEGGVTPYTWAVWSGTLPEGLTLNSGTGAIGGTPATRGSYQFVVRLSDSEKRSTTANLSITVQPAPLAITSPAALPDGTRDAAYTYTVAGTGGVTPYSWRVSAGDLPAGVTLSAAGALGGAPTAVGTFRFTLELSDAAEAKTTQDATLIVKPPPLAIATESLAAALCGTAYSQLVAASGGTEPYTFSVSAGALPAGLGIDSRTGAITGTPTAGGTANIVVRVADAGQLSATRSYSLVVDLPRAANPTFTGLADAMNAAQQPAFSLGLSAAYPLPLAGTLTLTFAPESGLFDDPAITFLSGGRMLPFTIPAGQTQASFSVPNTGLQTGTVAGTITITSTFQQGSTDVTPAPAPTRTIRIPRAAPGIGTVRALRTTGGLEVQILGHSTPRDITQARFRFTAAPGSTLQGADFTVQLGPAFTTWFGDTASYPFGSAFRYVQPFTVQGDTTAITSVEVTLSNSMGDSQPVTANF